MTNFDQNENPISLRDAESILAYIPHALGFQPKDSLVLLMFSGTTLEATMRIDLCHTQNNMSTWADQASAMTRRLDSITRVIPIVYVPAGDHASSAHYLELMDKLVEALESYAVDVITAYGVDDEVFGYSEDEYMNVDLSNLKFHPVSVQLVAGGSAPQPKTWNATDVPRWGNIDRVRALVADAEYQLPDHFGAWIGVLQQADPTTILTDEENCVKLLHGLNSKVVRDMLPVLAGLGEPAMNQFYAEVSSGVESCFAQFLLGQGNFTPNWERIDRLDAVLRLLVGGAEQDERHAIMSLIAWIRVGAWPWIIGDAVD